MEIKTNEYGVRHNTNDATVVFNGSFRLNGVDEYAPIVELLENAADANPTTLTLDLRGLEFLNSSGINVLSKYVIKLRQRGNLGLTIKGAKKVPWQSKSLLNLQRLMPRLKLELDE
jgi:hypothetical protein